MASQSKPVVASGDSLSLLFYSKPRSLAFLPRVGCLAALFALELIAFCYRLDSDLAEGIFRHSGAVILRGVVAFAVLLGTLGYARAGRTLRQISACSIGAPIGFRFLLAHFCVMGAFGIVSARWFAHHAPGVETSVLAVGWLTLGLMAIALAGFAFAPQSVWIDAFRATGNVWVYALSGGVLAPLFGIATQFLWKPATNLTFLMVRSILGLFVGGIHSDSAAHTIGTSNFAVEIAPRCSGLEGAGLMIVVGTLWLWLFRREFRFPRALLIIPVGVVALYLLNAVRIAALILIGNAGAPEIAEHGFHSQAGWIAFNAVAICLLVFAPRIKWLASASLANGLPAGHASASVPQIQSGDPNAAYLVPLITILVAAMLARTASAQFEWLYPFRLVAAAAVLWHYRSEYRRLDWAFSGVSVIVGICVLAMWLGLDRWFATPSDDHAIGLTLAQASPSARVFWILIRVLAAAVTVPIAEELAFRGFLMRRIVSPAFTSVASVTPLAVIVSSIAFGVLHGDRWLAGTIAGLLYAFAYLRRGKIGDAVVAHATTNALLAGYVLLWGKWSLW